MTMRTSLRITTVTLALLITTIACTKAPSDSQVATDIQSKLSSDSGLQGKQLVVQAANGSVTLSGTVDNDAQRDAAAKYASSEPGVKQVVNNLLVAPAATAEQHALAPPQPQTQMSQAEESPKPSPSSHRRRKAAEKLHENNSAENNVTTAQNTAPPMNHVDNTPTTAAAAPPPPPPPQRVTIPSGTSLSVRLTDPIDSETSQEGDTFHATLNSALSVDGETAIPAGYDVEGHIATLHSAGKFAGQSLVVLQLDRIKVGAKRYDIQTNQYEKKASSRSTNTAEKVGGGAVLGAIIGGLAGGGKGAGIGAAAGAGVGGGVQAVTKGKQIKLPPETLLNFTLQAPLTVTKTSEEPGSGRPRLERK